MQKENPQDLNISLGTIVDNDMDFLTEHLKGKDLGYCISVKNLLAVAYNELVQRKDGVLNKRKEFEVNNDTESMEGCSILVQQIYSKMQSIEDKYTYLSRHITDLQKSVIQQSGN